MALYPHKVSSTSSPIVPRVIHTLVDTHLIPSWILHSDTTKDEIEALTMVVKDTRLVNVIHTSQILDL